VQFDAMTRAGPDARNVKIGGKWGRIALDGRWFLEPRFDYLSNEPRSLRCCDRPSARFHALRRHLAD
jgi:hypothetical protein